MCVYSSLFVVDFLALEDSDSISIDAADYCANFKTDVESKISLINVISSYNSSSEDFIDNCLSALNSTSNPWYDPVIPSTQITLGDMCATLQHLYQDMDEDEITDFDDKVVYTYTLIY